MLVAADVVRLYPSIPHGLDLKAIEEVLEKRESSLSGSPLAILLN